jgi:hypothetical protein
MFSIVVVAAITAFAIVAPAIERRSSDAPARRTARIAREQIRTTAEQRAAFRTFSEAEGHAAAREYLANLAKAEELKARWPGCDVNALPAAA